VTERSFSHGQPDEWSRYRDGTADQHYSGRGAPGRHHYVQGGVDSGPGGPALAPTPRSAARQAADERRFFAALFDFSFTSFITTKIIKVLYALIMIMIVLSALLFTVSAFRTNATFGLLTLVVGDPLFVIIVLALWRLYFEFYIVFFRIAEDVRAMRERVGIG
jgi:hypothetical protein